MSLIVSRFGDDEVERASFCISSPCLLDRQAIRETILDTLSFLDTKATNWFRQAQPDKHLSKSLVTTHFRKPHHSSFNTSTGLINAALMEW
jgi:hypothetical protein